MPTKHNKKRYQRHEKEKPIIICTGKCWLEYRDEEEMQGAKKGDFKLHPSVESLHTIKQGEYESTGFSGYFRVDIHDGWRWQPVLLDDLLPGRENHFRKTEMPIDTFALCEELLEAMAGKRFVRTYREHYTLMADADEG